MKVLRSWFGRRIVALLHISKFCSFSGSEGTMFIYIYININIVVYIYVYTYISERQIFQVKFKNSKDLSMCTIAVKNGATSMKLK